MKTKDLKERNVQLDVFNKEQSYQRISYAYKGNRIEFRLNGDLMVNATEMAKPFQKRPIDFMRLPFTVEFLETYLRVKPKCENLTLPIYQKDNSYKSYYSGLVVTQKGGLNPGTWMHEDVAIEFARWLSPEFAIWCNDRIKEILLEQAHVDETNEKQIYEMVSKYLTDHNKSLMQYSKELSSRFHVPVLTPDIMPYRWNAKDDLKTNIYNLIICYRYNTASGLFNLYMGQRAKAESEVMRNLMQDFVSRVYKDVNILPH